MLHVSVIREIRRLLDKGELSQRSIAARLGVSRGVVGQIAAGTRGLHGSGETIRLAKRDPAEAIAARCPGCGGKVYQPCRLCRTRRFSAVHRDLPALLRYGDRNPPPQQQVA